MKTAYWLVVVLILLLGCIHSLIALFCREFNEDNLWFLGSGMAILFSGVINILRILNHSGSVRVAAITVNLSVVMLFVLALWVLPEAQVYVGIALFLGAAFLSLGTRRI
jgi:hypothetical protein